MIAGGGAGGSRGRVLAVIGRFQWICEAPGKISMVANRLIVNAFTTASIQPSRRRDQG
jgi:hypothetical protein